MLMKSKEEVGLNVSYIDFLLKGVFKLLLLLSPCQNASHSLLSLQTPLFNPADQLVQWKQTRSQQLLTFPSPRFLGRGLQSCFLAPPSKSFGRPNFLLATQMSSHLSKSSSPLDANLSARQQVSTSSSFMAVSTVIMASPANDYSSSSFIPNCAYITNRLVIVCSIAHFF